MIVIYWEHGDTFILITKDSILSHNMIYHCGSNIPSLFFRFTCACQVEKHFLICMGNLMWRDWLFIYMILHHHFLYVLVSVAVKCLPFLVWNILAKYHFIICLVPPCCLLARVQDLYICYVAGSWISCSMAYVKVIFAF